MYIELYLDDNDDFILFPAKWEICSTCDGNGKHSGHLGAITEEDRLYNWDEESWEFYMSGGYDKQCEKCNGSGKIKIVDYERLSEEDKRVYREYSEQVYRNMRERESEIRFGY